MVRDSLLQLSWLSCCEIVKESSQNEYVFAEPRSGCRESREGCPSQQLLRRNPGPKWHEEQGRSAGLNGTRASQVICPMARGLSWDFPPSLLHPRHHGR